MAVPTLLYGSETWVVTKKSYVGYGQQGYDFYGTKGCSMNDIISIDRIRQDLETCPETKIGDSRSVE